MEKKFEPTHFYVIFDPYLNNDEFSAIGEEYSQAHAFANLLKQRLQNDSDSYLYWGKLSLSKKKEKIPQSHYKETIRVNQKKGYPTYLYISDFRNFWVAKIESIEFGNDNEYYENALPFFRKWEKDNAVEAWFKVTDIDLLSKVSNETHQYIKCLQSESGHTRFTVTPFLSNLRYPLEVKDEDLLGINYFDGVSPKVFELNFDHKSFENKIKNIITKYSIHEEDFSLLTNSVKRLIITAEMDYFDDRLHNWPALYFNYYKALELQLNDVILGYLKKSHPDSDITIYAKGPKEKGTIHCYHGGRNTRGERPYPLIEFHGGFSIDTLLKHFLGNATKLSNNKPNSYFFDKDSNLVRFANNELSSFLSRNKFIQTRNIYSHDDIEEFDVTEFHFKKVRNELLGLGRESLLIQLSKASPLYDSYYLENKKAS
ncbi:MAG: hypothetical protein K9K67_11710 [Bacteriovoracaceae bacterium]|nr:hypothetical protein [Bacteriovoracaceae bacterium]